MTRLQDAERAFPSLRRSEYKKTSERDSSYNCIAWAAGDQGRKWWPDPMRIGYWPPGVPRAESIDAFVKAFESKGYEPTDASTLEADYERIAIYALDGRPKHAARQLESGKWTSKLGDFEDIEHALEGLVGDVYGQPVKFMRRRRSVLWLHQASAVPKP